MPEISPILLVEDDPKDVELALAALEDSALANPVLVARDGEEALDFLARSETGATPAAVLLDIKLPKVNGFEVLARIRQNPRLRSLPVVMLTGSRRESDMVESYARGANAHLVKPLGFAEFFDTIRHLGASWAVLNPTTPIIR